jgi:2-iminoacetate synthase
MKIHNGEGMTFFDIIQQYYWTTIQERIFSKTERDVELALHKKKRNLDDFMALISPAALPFLEKMAELSHRLTLKRFGRTIQLYIPLYLSNECYNVCTYCGFSFDNKIPRKTLTRNEIMEEIQKIKQMGFDHILLVTGEAPRIIHTEYIRQIIRMIKPYFANISIEVQPMQKDEYRTLLKEGLHSVYIYQETYHPERYRIYHQKGPKSNYKYRLETPDRLGQAEAYKIGLGVLLGLEDWRTDSFFLALHLEYLKQRYWKTRFSISFPRIRPAEGMRIQNVHISDKELVQLICAYRLLDENLELVLSTRERASFRDNVFPLGITTMSAASSTQPGGYAHHEDELEQFDVADHRAADEVARMIQSKGYQPVWKDWDPVINLANEEDL